MRFWGVFFVFLCGQGFGADRVDPRGFFELRAGTYRVKEVSGEVPKPENDTAWVDVEATEAVLTFPYCAPTSEVCDPGYRFFPYKDTRVTRDEFPDGSTRFTLHVKKGKDTAEYTWTEGAGPIRFFNPEYSLGGRPFPLEHVLEKK